MRILKIMLITLVLGSVGIMYLSCASKSNTASVAQNQVATVKRGDLVINVTGTGNLAFSSTVDLAFQMAGIVDKVNVQAGDSVKQGQVLATLDTTLWDENLASLEIKVLQAEASLKNAEYTLEQAEEPTTTGKVISAVDPLQIEIYELQVKVAQSGLENAKKQLADALNASPEITAPFDGFITTVNVSAGDAGVSGNGVPKGTVAMTIVDPNKFQADILVSELDIPQVKLGGDATVGIDAMSGIRLPAKVTYISPTATIQSGVVNYKVTVEITSLGPVQSSQPGQSSQSEQGGTTRPALSEQATAMPTSQAVQLRQGLSATVNIPIQEKDNVLLIPNKAITRQQGVAHVNVLKNDGTIEKRTIKTGISDSQNTEITDGLSEGEKVVITQTTTTTSTSTTRPGGPGFFP